MCFPELEEIFADPLFVVLRDYWQILVNKTKVEGLWGYNSYAWVLPRCSLAVSGTRILNLKC